MIPYTWVVFQTNVGSRVSWLFMDARDIYAAISNGPDATDIYTVMFPEGITVDETIEEVMNKHMEALYNEDISSEDDEDEPSGDDDNSDSCRFLDIIFELDDDSGPAGNFVFDSDIFLD